MHVSEEMASGRSEKTSLSAAAREGVQEREMFFPYSESEAAMTFMPKSESCGASRIAHV